MKSALHAPRRKGRTIARRAFVFTGLLAVAGPVFGTQTNWAAGTGDWFTGGNWSAGVPTSSDIAVIGNGGTVQITSGTAASSIVDVDNGTMTMTGGELSAGSLDLGSFGAASIMTFDGVGVTVDLAGSVRVGDSTGNASTLNIRNGATMTLQNLVVGASGAGTGTVTIDSGASVTGDAAVMPLDPASTGTLNLNGTAGNRGVLAVLSIRKLAVAGSAHLVFNGGVLKCNSNSMLTPQPLLRDFGAGEATIGAGGAFIDTNGFVAFIDSTTLSGTGGLTKQGAGTLRLDVGQAYTGGTTIEAGTVQLTASDILADTGAVTIAGGTLDFGSNSDTVGAVTLTSGSITGSGTLTGSSYAFTIASGTNTVPVKLAGTGRLTKNGTGTLVLTNANTYTGITDVTAGTLTLNGSTAAGSTVHIRAGATLNGSGTINGNVILHDGGTLTGVTVAGTTTRAPDPLLFAPNSGSNTVSVYTGNPDGTLTALTTIAVGASPNQVVVRGDQAFAYVLNANSTNINVVDTATMTVVQTIATGGTNPNGMALSPDGTKLYASNINGNNVSAYSANTTTGQLTLQATFPTGSGPRGLAFTPDGTRLYVAEQNQNRVTVLDTSNNTIVTTVAFSVPPEYVAINPAGTRAYVTNDNGVSVIDLSNNTVTATLPTGNVPFDVVVAPDGAHYYVANRNSATVSQFNASDNSTIGPAIGVGASPFGLAISADGAFLYVGNRNPDNNIETLAITPGTGALVAQGTIASGVSPVIPGVGANGNAQLATGRTFVANRAGALVTTGSGGASFTGGTLLVNASNLSFFTPMSLGAGGGTIDTNGNNATVTSVISGGNALTKAGTGTLTLSGTNTFSGGLTVAAGTVGVGSAGALGTGTTIVNASTTLDFGSLNPTLTAGTIRVNGASSGAFTLGSGATLGGTGTVTGAIAVNGGRIAPGNSIGTLNISGSLTWNGSATAMAFELGASNTADKIAITGALTKAGAGPYRFDFGGATTAGSYTLMTFASTTFSASDFSFTNLGGGLGGAFQIVGNTLVFNAGPAPAITSPTAAAVGNGEAFSYQITASGGATTFGATGLPAGLSVNSSTGLISGTINAPGLAVVVTLSASTSSGITGTGTLTLQVGKLGAQIVFGNLRQVYDGRPKTATITTTPANLALNVLYQTLPDGNVVSAPTNPGVYRVLASVSDPSYSGGALETLTITPAISTVPQKATATMGGTATFTAAATGGTPTYQWRKNGIDIPGATSATLTLNNVQPGNVGLYTVVITSGGASTTTAPVPLELSFTGKIAGPATEVGTDIKHPNGNTYDQVLLTGAAASVKADAGQVTRVSYVDLTNDIVQVEFSGAGVLTIALDNASGPAVAANYNQPDVSYMKGHASLTITGADATTNLGVFSVGRTTAVNQALFRDGVAYDGWADVALVSIASADGKFGSLFTGNGSYFASKGLTGVYAPGVQFTGTAVIDDVSGSDVASAVLVFGAIGDVSVAGGDLLQPNNGTVEVSGMSHVVFTAGTRSDGTTFAKQANRARLLRNGVDVTTLLVQ